MKWFNYSEFDSPDAPGSGEAHMDSDFLQMLDRARGLAGVPFKINSGYRTAAHNRKVGGAKHSQHLLGTAADIQIDGVNPGDVATFAKTIMPGYGGIKAYATFTHIDIRPSCWRG